MLQFSSILRIKGIDSHLYVASYCWIRGQKISCRLASSSVTSKPPNPANEKDEEHTPKSLSRPLGQLEPPQAGQNNGVDDRTWRQRRDDFFNYDKHLERRKQLTKAVAKPYFREWSNMRFHKGKTFLSNPKLFRADKALYLPNLQGITLASPKDVKDTTTVLENRVSLISVFSGTWAEHQTATFVNGNPELDAALADSKGMVQRVDINVEENPIKAALIKLFMFGIRKRLPVESHGRYFVVRRGITEGMREDIGLLNSKVGYVYLVDGECKIRWAGSGRAEVGEKESMIRGIRKLFDSFTKQQNERLEKDKENSAALVKEPVIKSTDASIE